MRKVPALLLEPFFCGFLFQVMKIKKVVPEWRQPFNVLFIRRVKLKFTRLNGSKNPPLAIKQLSQLK